MKKNLLLISAMVLGVTLMFSFSSCEEKETETQKQVCEHLYDGSEVIKAENCTEVGERHSYCKLCGEKKIYTVAPLGHMLSAWVVEQEGSCTEEEISVRECSRCDYSEEKETAEALGHNLSTWVVEQEGNCTDAEISVRECSRCDYSEKKETATALGHEMGEWEVDEEPTCTTKGRSVKACVRCDYTEEKELTLPTYTADQIYQMATDVVVEIVTYDTSGQENALGTGIVYSSNGKILTNYHVIDGAYSAKIWIGDKSYSVQKVLAYNEDIDLAVLKISATNLDTLHICSSPVQTGRPVYAIGSSRGMTATLSQGIITYANRTIDGVQYIQHDAAISNGNSGGPLINEYGEIIGINTMTIKDSQNLNFAIFAKEIDNLTYGKELTLSALYNQKHADSFTILKNYIIANGKWDSQDNEYMVALGSDIKNGTGYARTAYYCANKNTIQFVLAITDGYGILVEIDGLDGSYTYMWMDMNSGYYLSGNITASNLHNLVGLGYSDTNIRSTSLIKTGKEFACSMAQTLCVFLSVDLTKVGVNISDFGFIGY